MLARARLWSAPGSTSSCLLALNDDGRPAYDANHAASCAARLPVFACTPDQFPELMAVALKRQDIWGWAAERDIKLVRPQDTI